MADRKDELFDHFKRLNQKNYKMSDLIYTINHGRAGNRSAVDDEDPTIISDDIDEDEYWSSTTKNSGLSRFHTHEDWRQCDSLATQPQEPPNEDPSIPKSDSVSKYNPIDIGSSVLQKIDSLKEKWSELYVADKPQDLKKNSLTPFNSTSSDTCGFDDSRYSVLTKINFLKEHRIDGTENLDFFRESKTSAQTVSFEGSYNNVPEPSNIARIFHKQTTLQHELPIICTPQTPYLINSMVAKKVTIDEIMQRIKSSASDIQWSNLRSPREDNSKNVLLSQLSKLIASELPMMTVDGNLALYESNYWQYINLQEFITIVRRCCWQYQDILDNLSESNFREILIKLRTKPGFSRTAEEIKSDPDLLNFKDGAFDLRTGQFIKQAPDQYFFSYINVSIDEIGKGDGKYFEHYLMTSSGGDEALYTLILEVLGIIMSTYMMKGFFLFLGPSDGGKTQIAHIARKLLGTKFVTVLPSLNYFKRPHATATLKGKRACFCMDIARTFIDEDALAILKQVTGRDLVAIEPKYCDIEPLENTAKLILGANYLPPDNDPIQNDAFYRRMRIVPFPYSIPKEDQIENIVDIMEDAGELGYIVGKALKALTALRNRGYKFTEVNIDLNEFGAIETSNISPVEAFFNECCFDDPNDEASTDALYNAYTCFCRRSRKAPQTKISFSQEFAKLAISYKKIHTSRNGKTLSIYKGLKIKEDAQVE